ncbi:hypothetical protein J0910_07665 [Nocardiopsis sp. CNT-189]|uniref:hypothetical protein n=1 Tax=Nocardiopsis oceanisediminis TaxID=2816862 RepID=UPI003B376A43
MAVDRPSDPERLPCGRQPDEVAEHALRGCPTGHERDCPHCRAVAERHRPLALAGAELAAERPEPPPALVGSVMRAVRSQARPDRLLPVAARGPGRTAVRESAARALLVAACDTVPGAAVGRCRLTEGPDGLEIALSAHLTSTVPAPELAGRLRTAVRTAARESLGADPARIDIAFTDIG